VTYAGNLTAKNTKNPSNTPSKRGLTLGIRPKNTKSPSIAPSMLGAVLGVFNFTPTFQIKTNKNIIVA